ncbi:MAG: OmpW family outer membrane protein [Rubrivivax sp.]
MRGIALAVSSLVAVLAAPVAQAADDAGSWLVRGRAVHLASANKDDTGLGLTINDKWLPELDISYFFAPNFAVELILTYPQKQTVHSSVLDKDLGTFKHLPPTLTAQYHFTSIPGFRPYVGAGLNYTNISDVKILDGAVGLKHNSYGLAVQVGADIPVGGGWVVNLDAKKVQIGTNVYLNGADQGKFKVDPTLLSIGFGKRF